MYMTEKKVYIEGASQALFRDKRHILFYRRFYFEESIDLSYS